MGKRRFSRPPQINGRSRPSQRTAGNSLSLEVQEFKDTYVLERRVLEQFRSGEVSNYQPAPSLDGKSKFDTPEERPGVNQWEQMYQRLRQVQRDLPPVRYVQLLFRILRGSSLATPTLKQLVSPGLLQLVAAYVETLPLEIRAQLVAESQRVKSAIVLRQKADGMPLALAVYYALVDRRLELSPLFKYCLAVTTAEQVRRAKGEDSHCRKLEELAKQYEKLATADYRLFQTLYDDVWQDVIPERLRVAARS